MPTNFLEKAVALLTSVKGKGYPVDELQSKAIELAALIIEEANVVQTPDEKIRFEQLARMMKDTKGKIFTTCITDQCFRSQNSRRVADQICYNLKKYGVPTFLSFRHRFGLKLFSWFGKLLSPLTVPLFKRLIRQETQTVILPGEERPLAKHLLKRKKNGIRVNLNHLGEAILGEAEAQRRLKTYLEDLANPDIYYISVKISTLYSQLSLIARDACINTLADRLRQLYRVAQAHPHTNEEGTAQSKFVNLDMEEYRDLHLTVDLFCKVLSEPEFQLLSAGIVLQSYLPDAFPIQQKLTEWALERVRKEGLRLKSVSLKAQTSLWKIVEASLHDWPQAPYTQKQATDTNYKRMVEFGCLPARAKAVNLGIASHNLFDISFALLLRSQNNIESYVTFEMLEGMADHLQKVVHRLSGSMLLYCPVAKEEEFQNAVAYLIRRLDENTAPDNFLHSIFDLDPRSPAWKSQAQFFCQSLKSAATTSSVPNRSQDRHAAPLKPDLNMPFHNEPDTDWSLPKNALWAKEALELHLNELNTQIPLVIAGNHAVSSQRKATGIDPSRPTKELFSYTLAGLEDVDKALDCSVRALSSWCSTSASERSLLLARIAQGIRENRQKLIQAMVSNTGKSIPEADSEIAEAIDFAEYYRRNVEELHCFEDIVWTPKGCVLVTPPWNFPCSIPAGGILSSLAAGNCVIFKPAPEAVLVGWVLANIFWDAGVSKDILQFITCEDDPVGTALIKDPRVNAIVLTGATDTAKLFMKMRPEIDLLAETGGKNALIITNLADRDLAIKDLLHSAFSFSGQKCSACSLAIIEAEVYDDPHFLRQLRDAATSLPVGSQWDLSSKVTPLIRNPEPESALYTSLTTLEKGETWLLEPHQDPDNPHLWSPGIKLGVQPQSFSHQTEFFGPMLGIMRANSLDHAIELANGTPYGLTAGLHSLDDRERELWLTKIEAGNCYFNRGITGAIVQRQPFGGYKASSFGPGFKAGGPNYLVGLMHAREVGLPREKASPGPMLSHLAEWMAQQNFSAPDLQKWQTSAENYAFYWNGYFSKQHDPSQVLGENNLLRYLPHKNILLRVNPTDAPIDILRCLAASLTVGCPIEISGNQQQIESLDRLKSDPNIPCSFVIEDENTLANRLSTTPMFRARMLSQPSELLYKAFANAFCSLKVAPVLANGRIELLGYLHEQSLSLVYHRYGNYQESDRLEYLK